MFYLVFELPFSLLAIYGPEADRGKLAALGSL